MINNFLFMKLYKNHDLYAVIKGSNHMLELVRS
jgi:hypothetical protein